MDTPNVALRKREIAPTITCLHVKTKANPILHLLHHSANSAVLEPVIVQVTSGVKLPTMASVTEVKANALISWEVVATMTTILFVVVMARLMPTSVRQPMQVSTLII